MRVLFLCTHNSSRSQMAEGLLRARGGTRTVSIATPALYATSPIEENLQSVLLHTLYILYHTTESRGREEFHGAFQLSIPIKKHERLPRLLACSQPSFLLSEPCRFHPILRAQFLHGRREMIAHRSL